MISRSIEWKRDATVSGKLHAKSFLQDKFLYWQFCEKIIVSSTLVFKNNVKLVILKFLSNFGDGLLMTWNLCLWVVETLANAISRCLSLTNSNPFIFYLSALAVYFVRTYFLLLAVSTSLINSICCYNKVLDNVFRIFHNKPTPRCYRL